MDPTLHLALACLAFLAIHVVPSTPLRAKLVGSIGLRPYLGLFSLASLGGIVWMVLAFKAAPFAPLWAGLRHLPSAIMPFALVFVVAGGMTPNPTAVGAEKLLSRDDPARGILRVTRHPVMWGIMLWAAAHLLARGGDPKSTLFFGSFLLLAAAGTVLLDQRKARLGETWTRFAQLTSNVPFVAIAQQRNRFVWREIGLKKVIIALVAYGAIFFLHAWLFGVRPY